MAQQPPEVQAAAGSQFRATNAVDYELLALANTRLDTEVAALGPRFADELALFRHLRRTVQKGCSHVDYVMKQCFFRDEGCGFPCVEKLTKFQRNGKR